MDRRTFLTSCAGLLSGCGGGGGTPAPAAKSATNQVLAPDHPALSYTDCAAVDVTAERARFCRPIINGFGYEWVNPGARVRFWTDSETVTFKLRHTGLMSVAEVKQNVGAVLVDGVPTLWTEQERVTVSHVGKRMRLHELVMPYSDAVDFLGVEIDGTAAAAPRVGQRLVVLGDSITHGFWSSSVLNSWPFLLAQKTGMELVNLGYGGRMCVPSDGTAAAGCRPDVLVYLIGYNEFSQQKDPADFADRHAQTIANVKAGRPGTRIVAITPIWSPNEKPIPLQLYRDAICESDVTVVDGLSLTVHALSAVPDTVHPSDEGSRSIADALASVI